LSLPAVTGNAFLCTNAVVGNPVQGEFERFDALGVRRPRLGNPPEVNDVHLHTTNRSAPREHLRNAGNIIFSC
jgi:hypothetical protein